MLGKVQNNLLAQHHFGAEGLILRMLWTHTYLSQAGFPLSLVCPWLALASWIHEWASSGAS